MQPVSCKYYLVRKDPNGSETVVFQSNDREEIKWFKGELESQLPREVFEKLLYTIRENQDFIVQNN